MRSNSDPHLSYFLCADKANPELRIKTMLSKAETEIGPAERAITWGLRLEDTCLRVGIASPVCRAVCYVHGRTADRPNARSRLKLNYAIAQRLDFVELLTGVIINSGVRTFKIHWSGDFFSADYIDAWTTVVGLLPEVRFWCYTRAWFRANWREALLRLNDLRNMQVNLSTDRSMLEIPAELNRLPRTPLADTDYDVPAGPNLIAFRAASTRKMDPLPIIGQAKVCPLQDGQPDDRGLCVDCGICLPPLRRSA